ncbi:DUF4838 domain-containing protein [Daejeonella sp.]|uniref:DUF4838 domain-containing protein n=1 Tax=Daejeonella sp. TaxID=2805397 RepID=UPI0030BCD104
MNYITIKKSLLFIAVFLTQIATTSLAQTEIVIGNSGKTAYSIYIDPSSSLSVKQAAADLKDYFNKVAGFSPNLIVSSKPPSEPFISLGSTSAWKAAGLDASAFSDDGFRMIAKGRNLFLFGPDTQTGKTNNLGGVSNGTSNAVYTFIEDYLGVTWLMPGDLGEDFKKVSKISIPSSLDRTETSPLNYRVLPMGNSRDSLLEEWNRRMKLGKVAAVQHAHAWAQTIPPSAFEKHPEWFAEIGGKPLPPAGRYKFETTNQELVNAYAEVIKETFRKNPDLRWYSLSPSDGGGWSESKSSTALLEKDPHGALSRTKLVLKFYNDIAKIVRKEFPDHKLGGYIYSSYLYPPEAGIPKLEPNLALVVATSNSYGYQLYRPSVQQDWDKLMRSWGESAKKDGFDVYYYDLPTVLVQPYGNILPPGPDILNYTFDRVKDYGFKGAYFSGGSSWLNSGAGNYTTAKLEWKPGQNAHELLKTYYTKAYGAQAASYMEKLYALLDNEYRKFYIAHPKANYNMTQDHYKEIYGANYKELEEYYMQALTSPKEPKQQKRLELFGQIFSLMQWNLRTVGALPANFKSPLTLSDDQIDRLIFKDSFSVLPRSNDAELLSSYNVILEPPLAVANNPNVQSIPARGKTSILLYVPKTGEVRIDEKRWDGKAEFVHYSLFDEEGKKMQAGSMAEGRIISFAGQQGKTYMLHIPSRDALFELNIHGAAAAYKSNTSDGGMRMVAGSMKAERLPLYFYVPAHIKDFSITLNTLNAIADVISPDGRVMGQLNNENVAASRLAVTSKDIKEGFWQINVHKFNGTCTLTLDNELPQWFSIDPAQPLKIITKQ